MADKIAGTAFLKVDGEQISIGGTFKLAPFLVSREGVVGLSGVAGYKENNVVPYVEIEALKTPKTDLEKIQKVTDATVTCELASGEVWAFRNAWFSGLMELDAAEGKMTIKFEALKAEKTTSGAAAS